MTTTTASDDLATVTRVGRHFADYGAELVYASPRLRVFWTAYAEYPRARLDTPTATVLLEGRIYDQPAAGVEPMLDQLAEMALGAVDPARALARWLAAVDGDFVAVCIDRATDAAVVVTDRHGRLPLHHGRRGARVVVSREAGIAAELLPARRLSRRAIAQYLMLGYPLGSATLFEDVEQVPPAALLRVGEAPQVLSTVDFEAKQVVALRGDRLPELLAQRLVRACRARLVDDRPVLVSLSGGIDSRLVLAALLKAGVRPVCVTHREQAGCDGPDADTAARVAACAGVPWQLVRVPPPTGAMADRLLRMRQGANHLGMSRVMPYLETLAERFGRQAIFFTGDHGDRILSESRPVGRVRSDDAAACYLLRKEAILPPSIVSAVTGIPVAELVTAVRARLAGYPERSPELRYLHFLYAERVRRHMFEGEERNRCWFWSVTPFLAPDVFELATSVPPQRKAFHRLRVEVLQALSPELAAIRDVNTGGTATSLAYKARQRLRALGRAALYRATSDAAEQRLKHLLQPPHGYDARSNVIGCVREQLRHCAAIAAYLDRDGVERLLANAASYDREQFSVLFTVTSLIEWMASGVTALGQLASQPLG